ncbi:MAG: nuclear transport factor 2 family protein [Chitinophagaceae bacterium]|nr:nuclear transport factor 2 family protein [Chitinophagaceae bacterium]
MKKLLFILLVALSPVLSFAQHSPKQMEVMMKMLALKNALIAKDSMALDDLLANDVTYGHTNGLIQTKAQLIRSVVSKEQDYKNIVPSDMNIRIYDNTAVVTMKSAVTMNYQGKPLDMNMYITLVWIKKDKWQLVARQSVKQ